jgi:hypothetical protein
LAGLVIETPPMGDPNPLMAYALAAALAPAPSLPPSLADIEQRAGLAMAVDRPFAGEVFGGELIPLLVGVAREIGISIAVITDTSASYMPDVSAPLERLHITLRLWAGCISAAKTIAHLTRSGPNSAEGRAQAFASIESLAMADVIFGAGVEAAPTFLRRRGQDYSFEGVPDNSRVRRYPR